MTKFRVGAAIGLATGYYFGTRAGRRRYEQINRAARAVLRRSETIDQAATAVGRARAVVDLSKERVHTPVDHSPLVAVR